MVYILNHHVFCSFVYFTKNERWSVVVESVICTKYNKQPETLDLIWMLI
jgi:hypothetical protein